VKNEKKHVTIETAAKTEEEAAAAAYPAVTARRRSIRRWRLAAKKPSIRIIWLESSESREVCSTPCG